MCIFGLDCVDYEVEHLHNAVNGNFGTYCRCLCKHFRLFLGLSGCWFALGLAQDYRQIHADRHTGRQIFISGTFCRSVVYMCMYRHW